MNFRRSNLLLLCAALGLPAAGARAQSVQSAPVEQKPVSEHDKSEASKAFLEGAKALQKNDLPEAEKQFERAIKIDPGNADYRAALTIAKEHQLTQLVQDASKARLMGHDDASRALLAQAYLIDPNNLIVQQHIDDLAHDAESEDAVLL